MPKYKVIVKRISYEEFTIEDANSELLAKKEAYDIAQNTCWDSYEADFEIASISEEK